MPSAPHDVKAQSILISVMQQQQQQLEAVGADFDDQHQIISHLKMGRHAPDEEEDLHLAFIYLRKIGD